MNVRIPVWMSILRHLHHHSAGLFAQLIQTSTEILNCCSGTNKKLQCYAIAAISAKFFIVLYVDPLRVPTKSTLQA